MRLTAIAIAAAMVAPSHAFTPCPRDASAPPMLITLRESPVPPLVCTALSLRTLNPLTVLANTQAHACTLVNEHTAIIVVPTGPAVVIGLALGFTPDRTLAHEWRHAFRWDHPTALSLADGWCNAPQRATPPEPDADDHTQTWAWEYPISNARARCAGRTACSTRPAPQRCQILVQADGAEDGDYADAIRGCFSR
mgnify:FL=1